MDSMKEYGKANFNQGMSQLIVQVSKEDDFQKLDIVARLKVMEILDKAYKRLLKEVELP